MTHYPARPLQRVLRIVAYIACAYWSGELLTDLWYVGPMFGAVVLLWQVHDWRRLLSWRHGAFLVASTLIYALVIRLHSTQERLAVEVAVAIGTILLPIAHGLLLGVARRHVQLIIPALFVLWYALVHMIAWIEGVGVPWLPGVFHMAAMWQALYLLLFFRPRK
jgi:hypothetical protein